MLVSVNVDGAFEREVLVILIVGVARIFHKASAKYC